MIEKTLSSGRYAEKVCVKDAVQNTDVISDDNYTNPQQSYRDEVLDCRESLFFFSVASSTEE